MQSAGTLRPVPLRLGMRATRFVTDGVIYVVLTLFTVVVGYPVVAMVLNSFKGTYEIYANPWGLPRQLLFSNYGYAAREAQIPVFMLNSLIVAVATVILTVVLASTAAYAFATFRFHGSRVLFLLFALLLIVPVPVGIIPLYIIVSRLHLTDTYGALILPYTAGGLPLSIFLLRAYFESIPQELSDAARIDGCTHAHAFVRVILPVATPALATVTILQFINSWNEFFLALIFIHKTSMMTLPLGLQSFFYLYRVQWSYLFAALSMALVPIIVVYLLMQRQFINGLTAGALKG
jgi:raffinose/stachyose/melibiose transport system permease protein